MKKDAHFSAGKQSSEQLEASGVVLEAEEELVKRSAECRRV